MAQEVLWLRRWSGGLVGAYVSVEMVLAGVALVAVGAGVGPPGAVGQDVGLQGGPPDERLSTLGTAEGLLPCGHQTWSALSNNMDASHAFQRNNNKNL